MKKALLGIILAVVFIYLSLRGINFSNVGDIIANVNLPWALLALLLILATHTLRSVRWGFILQPIVKVDQFTLFSITSVGFLAIAVIPARLGELVRPFLVSRKKDISMSAALGTVFLERVLDLASVLLIGMVTLLVIPLPSWFAHSVAIAGAIAVFVVAGLWFIVRKRKKFAESSFFLPAFIRKRYETKIRELFSHFIDGLAAIKGGKRFVQVALLSLCLWSINGLSIYVLFIAFEYSLSLWAAFTLMLILILGIAIPTSPGFVGNWHYACIATLTLLFHLGKDDALSFAILYHALSMGMILILGLAFLPANRFSLNKLTGYYISK